MGQKRGSFWRQWKEDRGNAHGVPANDHGEESEEFRRCYMVDAGGIRHTRVRGNPVG